MKGRKPMKKGTVIIILIIVFIIAAVLILPSMFSPKNSTPILSSTQYTVIKKSDIADSINVSGTIESMSSENVYTTLSYRVREVSVEEGDKVKAGDVLAVLDTDDLEKDILQQEESIAYSKTSSAIDLENKKRSYESALSLYNRGLNTEVVNANAAVTAAGLALTNAQNNHDYNLFLYDEGEISKNDLALSEVELTNAKLNLDKADTALENTKNKVSLDLKRAENDLKNAEANVSNKAQDIALEKLKSMLSDAVITAPVDGTITAVNATVGNIPSGVLFVIDDLDNLEIISSIKEFDVSNVVPGQKCTIKTDATGELLMDGSVKSIAPASDKSSGISATDVSFETIISIVNPSAQVRIGMNARVNITLEERADVYTVPYDAVIQNENDEYSLYIAEETGGTYTIKSIPVKVGIENDFYAEVSGEAVQDGLIVINNPSGVTVGGTVGIEKQG